MCNFLVPGQIPAVVSSRVQACRRPGFQFIRQPRSLLFPFNPEPRLTCYAVVSGELVACVAQCIDRTTKWRRVMLNPAESQFWTSGAFETEFDSQIKCITSLDCNVISESKHVVIYVFTNSRDL